MIGNEYIIFFEIVFANENDGNEVYGGEGEWCLGNVLVMGKKLMGRDVVRNEVVGDEVCGG